MSDGRTWGTIVGGVVGFFTAGVGFAAGAAIGGAVGGLLEPKQRTETNRIDDIKVSLSKYGDGIPETWGNNIPSATCVWSTYIIQMAEEPTGGKGGGVENTNYRQFIQSMWCLGRTPPPGTTVTIRKAWINGKLNYDASSGLSAGQALATEENPWASIALLPGFDDQLPVPMIEIYEGIGNVPAFRGRICLFIFGLECPGGRVPQLQFELCIGASYEPVLMDFNSTGIAPITYTGIPGPESVAHVPTVRQGGNNYATAYMVGHDFVRPMSSTRTVYSSDLNFQALTPALGSQDRPQSVCSRIDGDDIVYEAIDHEAGQTLSIYDGSYADGRSQIQLACFDPATQRYALKVKNDSQMLILPDDIYCPALTGFLHGRSFYNSILSRAYHLVSGSLRMEQLQLEVDGTWTLLADVSLGVFAADAVAHLLHTEDGLYVEVVEVAADTVSFLKVGASVETLSSISSPLWPAASETTFFCSDSIAIIGPFYDGLTAVYKLVRHKVLIPAAADVAGFVANQAERSGLTPEQFDVSAINDNFWGLTLKSPASARANVTPVMTYSAMGVVEEDGLLRFFHRKEKASVTTISYDELGCAEVGGETGDPFPVTHLNAQELPRSITLSYNDPNFDYQVSTVKAMMLTADSVLDATESIDMAIDGDRAATIARRMLLERWIAQNSRACAVSRKFSFLSAGDVITVEYPRGVFSAWMTSKITDTGGRVEIECFPSDAGVLVQSVPGPSAFLAQSIEDLPSPQLLALVDGPIIQDVDNNAGIYAAMEPMGSSAHGAELFIGDDDTSLLSRGIVANAAVIGSAENALGSWSSGIMDEANVLVVNIGTGVLNSTSRALIDTTTVNAFAIGANGRWEYAQFLRAEDLGGGRYRLSGLIRGAKGTERNRGNHVVGDRFVLWSKAGTLRPTMDLGALNSKKQYRAVSTGRSLNSASSQTYANTGEGLKTYSPWDARWTKATSNDITLTWQRRSRLKTDALMGDIPLGEAIEAYEIDFYTSSALTTLAGTLASTAPSLTITSAQQAAMGLTPGATPYRRIYQVSATVGRGAPLEAIT